jgi:hypothetical protein
MEKQFEEGEKKLQQEINNHLQTKKNLIETKLLLNEREKKTSDQALKLKRAKEEILVHKHKIEEQANQIILQDEKLKLIYNKVENLEKENYFLNIKTILKMASIIMVSMALKTIINYK